MNSKFFPILCLLLLVFLPGCGPKRPPRTAPKKPPATRPQPPKAPPVQPQPAPAPTVPVTPKEPVAPEPEPEPAQPLLLKVGLASDLDSVTFPCCEEPLDVSLEDQALTVATSLKVEPAAGTSQKGYYRLQVAALRDERQAQNLARRLARDSGQPGEAYFDAGIDLYRVRVGHYATREAAEADLRRLGAIGVTGAFVVNEGGSVTEPALRITLGQATATYPGRWLSVSPVGNPSVRVRGQALPGAGPGLPERPRSAQPHQRALRGGLPAGRGAERDGAGALQSARGSQGPDRGGPHLRPAQPRRVRPRGVRHLRHPPLPGVRRHERGAPALGPRDLRDGRAGAPLQGGVGGRPLQLHLRRPYGRRGSRLPSQGGGLSEGRALHGSGSGADRGGPRSGRALPGRPDPPPAAAGRRGLARGHPRGPPGAPGPPRRPARPPAAARLARPARGAALRLLGLRSGARRPALRGSRGRHLSAQRSAAGLERGGPAQRGLPHQERPSERAPGPAAGRGRGRADASRPRRASPGGTPGGRLVPLRQGRPARRPLRQGGQGLHPAGGPRHLPARGRAASTARPSPWCPATT